jgi:hypothetical protein
MLAVKSATLIMMIGMNGKNRAAGSQIWEVPALQDS